MAAVSQHAMRRHPGGPLDPSTSLGPAYYAVSHQQVSILKYNNIFYFVVFFFFGYH